MNEASRLAKNGLLSCARPNSRCGYRNTRHRQSATASRADSRHGSRIPRRVRYDEASVRVSAVIQSRYSRLPQGISVAVISGVSVAVIGLDVSLKRRQALRRCLDDKLPLVLSSACPATVKRLDGADDLNASRKARASDAARQLLRRLFAVHRGHDLHEVSYAA